MLARIPEARYDAVAEAFTANARGRVSDDWTRDWRDWCRADLVRRTEAFVKRGGV
jgi:hypothetical protein